MTRIRAAALALIAGAVLGACAAQEAAHDRQGAAPSSPGTTQVPTRAPTQAAEIDALLADFEDDALMPPLLANLPLEPGRAYAILAQFPAPTVIDLSEANRARRGLAGLLNPIASARAGTGIGHAMIGWRCADGRQGLASQTGGQGAQGLRMLLSGWGVGTMLAEFDDGMLYRLADLPRRYSALEARSGTRVAAFEIAPEGCEAMRRALADYITHPAQPVRRFTMVPDPAAMQGAGCGSFALWLAGQGGLFRGIEDAFHRDVPLADSYLGWGQSLPRGVRPWLPPGVSPETLAPLPPLSFLRADWDEGRDLGSVRLMDMELLLLAIDRAQARGGIARPARLRPGDTQARRLQQAADRWLARYGRATPLRMGAARAVVLHRR